MTFGELPVGHNFSDTGQLRAIFIKIRTITIQVKKPRVKEIVVNAVLIKGTYYGSILGERKPGDRLSFEDDFEVIKLCSCRICHPD